MKYYQCDFIGCSLVASYYNGTLRVCTHHKHTAKTGWRPIQGVSE